MNRRRPQPQPRTTAIDCDPPCRPPAWVLETLHDATHKGFHVEQRKAMYRVLCSIELDECDLPQLSYNSFRPEAAFGLWWQAALEEGCTLGSARAVEAECVYSQLGMCWEVRCRRYLDAQVVERYVSQLPGPALRRMLAIVYPELDERR